LNTTDQDKVPEPTRLKNCPFCGGEPEVTRTGSGRQSSVIECTNCGCTVEANESDWNTGMQWNRRKETTKVGQTQVKLFRNNTPTKPGHYLYREAPNLWIEHTEVTYLNNNLVGTASIGSFYMLRKQHRKISDFLPSTVWSNSIEISTELASECKEREKTTPKQ